MAAALDKDPVALEQEHLNTMKFLYGPHFEQGFAHVQQLPHCPNLRMSSVSVKRVKKSFYCQAPGPGLDQPGPGPDQPGHQMAKPNLGQPNLTKPSLDLDKFWARLDTIIKQATPPYIRLCLHISGFAIHH